MFAQWLSNWKRKRRFRRMSRDNDVRIHPEDLSRIDLDIEGRGNRVIVGRLKAGHGRISVGIFGNDCAIELAEDVAVIGGLDIFVGQDHPNFGAVSRCAVRIGTGTSIGRCDVLLYNSNTSVSVGEDCMIASDCSLHDSDAHPVYDLESGRLLNAPHDIRLGDHVWLGAKSVILKNVTIPDGCIVGWGSVVTRSVPDANVAVAGNPARVITPAGRHVRWSRTDPAYIDNRKETDA